MAEQYSFRTVVGGFHKGDVADYISQSAARHQAEIQTLEDRISELEAENQALRAQLSACGESADASVDSAAESAAPDAEEADPIERRELEAYRRAEALERVASRRVRLVYDNMQALCRRSADQADSAERDAREALSVMEAQLELMRRTMNGFRETLENSARELESMTELVPDPAEGLEETDV